MIRFPLILSCGHGALSSCGCRSIRQYESNGDSPIDRVLREWQGAWRGTLEGYGVQLPSGRHHGPCPICGGKDRFRFDDKDGRGTWFCSHCDPMSGGGLLLLARWLGKPTIEVAKELLGQVGIRSSAPVRMVVISDDTKRQQAIETARQYAERLLSISTMAEHPYMAAKGLHGQWLVNSEPIMTSQRVVPPGELLLVPAYKDGRLTNVQQITPEGKKRPIYGGDMQGVYHCIDGHQRIIAIVEGYATGVTVNLITGAMTYCAFNTGNLATVGAWVRQQHPDAKLVYFADNDEHGAGERYAEQAAAPIGAMVVLPPELGDWDDYRQHHGIESTRQEMRQQVSAVSRAMSTTMSAG